MGAIAEAASVLLARGPGSDDVFLVGRAPNLRFMGGFVAFPGGRVHASDSALVDDRAGLDARHVAAVRELFEETGILLARDAGGAFPAADERLASLRRDLLADRVTFRDLLAALGLSLTASDLRPVGSLLTPDFAPIRFDTAFYVAFLPPGQSAEVWPGELTEGMWQSAEAALRAWEAGALLLSPPTMALLEPIRGHAVEELPGRVRPLLDAIAAGEIHPIFFSPGVQMIPLHTEGLPPSTHTNAYLVGTGPRYLLDPGPTDPIEQQRLFDLLDAHAAAGRSLTGIVLTHHHPDHVGAAAVCAHRYGVPVLAHAQTARALEGKVRVDQLLDEGATLDLGEAPHGHGRWHLDALHTPGHAPGHLTFHECDYGLLFAGDMVSTLSSVCIAPPEGNLAVYLDSLRRLRTVPARLLLPGHGSPSSRPGFVLEQALAHRAERERQLLAALGTRPRTITDLAQEIYRGLPAPLMRFAELQVLAGLKKLEHEGKAQAVAGTDGQAWVERSSD